MRRVDSRPRSKLRKGPTRMQVFVGLAVTLPVVGLVALVVTAAILLSGSEVEVGQREPAWSPTASLIAYSSNERDGFFDIYVMNSDGTGVRNLTNREDRDVSPVWSPDGSKIAFISRVQGKSDIHIVNHDGTSLRTLTGFKAQQYSSPVWSPDGTKIAFTSNRDVRRVARPSTANPDMPEFPQLPPPPELYVMNADGSGQTRLTFNNFFDGNLTWAPDGLRLAFQSNQDGDHEIFIVNVDGTSLRQITSNEHVDALPSWSPDGEWIAFTSNRPKTGFGSDLAAAASLEFASGSAPTDYDIYLAKPDGTRQFNWSQMSDTNDTNPVWSPDSQWIAFEGRYVLSFNLSEGINEIYVMLRDGLNRRLTRLTHNRTQKENLNEGPVVWSQSGNAVAFITRREGSPRVQVVNLLQEQGG